MTASDHLNKKQFSGGVQYSGLTREHPHGSGKPQHLIETKHGRSVLGFALFNPDGELDTVMVKPEHQRQGVATAMWNHAKVVGINAHHGRHRTKEGDAWARTVGGHLPRNSSEMQG